MENFLAVGSGLINLQAIREYEFFDNYQNVKVTFLNGSECVYSDLSRFFQNTLSSVHQIHKRLATKEKGVA